MSVIEKLYSLEILDSRGRPTLKTTCQLKSGIIAEVSVPSGASTGEHEAHELRDGDKKRYNGFGVRDAVKNVNDDLAKVLCGQDWNQKGLDAAMNQLDGTVNKSRLGANAILSVSLAFARAEAAEQEIPLYSHFANLADSKLQHLPRLTINLFSGGKHAGGQVPIQDLLMVPSSAKSIDESLSMSYAVYQNAAKLIFEKYGMRSLTADEGGLAPAFDNIEKMFEDAIHAIENAALRCPQDVALAVDVASSHFYQEQKYFYNAQGGSASEMIAQVEDWVTEFGIVSVEDGLAENDWENWPQLRTRLESTSPEILVLGDDLLCTNPARIQRAIDENAANALLLKVNQIGTLSEAMQALHLAKNAGWKVTVSARSGETEDNWLADLAVGWGADQIKIGSITQSERLAKYNRLLEIESETGWSVVNWPNK
jgi:enolase